MERGYIYIIKCEDFYKIGRAQKLAPRLSAIQVANPLPLKLVFALIVDKYQTVESSIHHQFREKRVRGEWFALDEEDIALAVKMIIAAVDLGHLE